MYIYMYSEGGGEGRRGRGGERGELVAVKQSLLSLAQVHPQALKALLRRY